MDSLNKKNLSDLTQKSIEISYIGDFQKEAMSLREELNKKFLLKINPPAQIPSAPATLGLSFSEIIISAVLTGVTEVTLHIIVDIIKDFVKRNKSKGQIIIRQNIDDKIGRRFHLDQQTNQEELWGKIFNFIKEAKKDKRISL